jgi:Na+/proline symporter
MSSIDTLLNFLTAGLFNDFYRRHIRPDATLKEQIRFCRIATLLVTAMAVLWAKVLIGTIDNDWIQFINTVIGVFILPLAVLRWIWWRINIWGEIVGYVGSVPLGYLIWFVFDFKSAPYWQAFSVLFILGWGLILLTTLVTKPESTEVLERFYQKVRPPGFWGPIKSRQNPEMTRAHQKEVRLDLAGASVGVVFCLSIVTTMTSAFARQWPLSASLGLLSLISGAAFVWFTIQGEKLRSDRGVIS